jgi:hypothetical protein
MAHWNCRSAASQDRHVHEDDLGRAPKARGQGFGPTQPVEHPCFLGDELRMRGFVFRLRGSLPAGLPGDGVDLAIGQPAPGGDLPCQHGFAAAGIAGDEDAGHGFA